ncbi:MAG: CaiB/BaiF CoA-transferase family protein [Candidatus Acidiferrum sp.]
MRPLDGIVVLDLTRFLPGAVATATLASFGAEVIKIEQPGSGDPARGIEGASWLFAETNRGKKSVALDLNNERGKKVFRKLVTTADVVIESFRPHVMNRLGIGYKDLCGLNKGLIYAALSGYGRSGPYAALAGHDINYIAMSGLLDLISPAGGMPLIPEIQIADIAGGSSHIVIGILLALVARDKTGRGQRVDVSMTGGLDRLLSLPLAALHSFRHPLKRGKELLSGAYACYHPYRAKDGRWLVVGALEPKFWANLCRQIQCVDLIADQFSPVPRQRRVKNRLSRVFKTRTAEEWFDLLRSHDCCVTPVRTLQEAVADGQFHSRALGIELARTAGATDRTPAPHVGQHSAEILKRSGLTKSELRVLQNAGVVSG